jgi:hypothetical protein
LQNIDITRALPIIGSAPFFEKEKTLLNEQNNQRANDNARLTEDQRNVAKTFGLVLARIYAEQVLQPEIPPEVRRDSRDGNGSTSPLYDTRLRS